MNNPVYKMSGSLHISNSDVDKRKWLQPLYPTGGVPRRMITGYEAGPQTVLKAVVKFFSSFFESFRTSRSFISLKLYGIFESINFAMGEILSLNNVLLKRTGEERR